MGRVSGFRATTMLYGAVGAIFLATFRVQAAEPAVKPPSSEVGNATAPAVDGFNAKFDAMGGSLAKKSFAGVRGVFTMPLGASYGLQVDGIASRYDGDFYGIGAAHLFWRNPSVALVGLYADSSYLDKAGGIRANHVGGEINLYFDRWALGGPAGVEFGNSTSETIGSQTYTYDIKTRFFDKIDLSYYVTDNFKLSVGHLFTGGRHAASLGVEWGFPLSGNTMGALFVNSTISDNDVTSVWGGLRFYFGERQKPLIERHRHDDPDPVTPQSLLTITNSVSAPSTPPKKTIVE